MRLTLLEIPKPDPPPWIERERHMRRLTLLDADKDLRVAVEAVKHFQNEHLAVDEKGLLVRKITYNQVVSNEALLWQRQRLMQDLSEAHDAFQRAIKSWSELQP
jgi:hypothetical protein